MSRDQEIILAQEQSVLSMSSFEREVEGTLILTNQRLIFVGATQEEDVRIGVGSGAVRFADVDDLDSLPKSEYNISIPLAKIDSDRGSHLGHHTLKVKWAGDSGEMHEEFVEQLSGGRKKNLNDWARVIEKLKSGELVPKLPKVSPPGRDTLDGRILYVLSDMQEKGPLEIEEEVEASFKLDLDPDEVEESCKKLAGMGLVDAIHDRSGEDFYRKQSPLGEDDLSS